ncbi:uncharacterized protein [Ptychodera flava]|uniref:uncharacterized protein n=1 Tax=Ptychodera flava TaxID=63121 RepID=UPI003969D82A
MSAGFRHPSLYPLLFLMFWHLQCISSLKDEQSTGSQPGEDKLATDPFEPVDEADASEGEEGLALHDHVSQDLNHQDVNNKKIRTDRLKLLVDELQRLPGFSSSSTLQEVIVVEHNRPDTAEIVDGGASDDGHSLDPTKRGDNAKISELEDWRKNSRVIIKGLDFTDTWKRSQRSREQ